MDSINTTQPENRKKIILIAGIVICVLLIIAVVFFIRRYSTKPTQEGINVPAGENVNGNIITLPGGTATEEGTPTGETTPKEQFIELYKGPVAGYTALSDGHTILLFDRAKGLLFTVNTNTGTVDYVNNQPILRVHDATFLGEEAVVLRSLDNFGKIKSRLYQIKSGTNNETRYQLSEPIDLPNNVLELGVSPDHKKILLVVKTSTGADIDLYDNENQNLSTVIALPISEWIPYITNYGDKFLVAKASTYAKSGAYKITGDKLTMVAQADTEQTTLPSPDGKLLLNETLNKQGLAIMNPSDIEAIPESSLPIKFYTIADKCVWDISQPIIFCGVPTNNISTLDDWYLGKTNSRDMIVKQRRGEENPIILANGTPTPEGIDSVKLAVTASDLFMLNKTDEHLWKIKLLIDESTSGVATSTVDQTINQE